MKKVEGGEEAGEDEDDDEEDEKWGNTAANSYAK